VKEKSKIESLEKTGYQHYYDIVFQKFQQDIPGVLLNMINDERNGVDIDRDIVSIAIQSFVEIGGHIVKSKVSQDRRLSLYHRSFENKFLDETRAYYQTRTQEWLE